MNPSKVGKMDEEVQKWSRKDPQAIKKAMIYPGNYIYSILNEFRYSKFRATTTFLHVKDKKVRVACSQF